TFIISPGYAITLEPYNTINSYLKQDPILIILKRTNTNVSIFPVRPPPEGIPPLTPPDLGNGIIDIPGEVGFAGLPKKLERGYVQSWNLTLQKELKYGFTGQVGYVATRQTRMLSEYLDMNAGQVIGAGDVGRTLYPKFGRVAVT